MASGWLELRQICACQVAKHQCFNKRELCHYAQGTKVWTNNGHSFLAPTLIAKWLRDRKQHIIFFNLNFLPSTQSVPFPPRKRTYVPRSLGENEKRNPHKPFRGNLGLKKGVPLCPGIESGKKKAAFGRTSLWMWKEDLGRGVRMWQRVQTACLFIVTLPSLV